MCNDVHVGHVEEWHIPGKKASKWVCYRLQTWTIERLSARHQTVLVTFLGFISFTAAQKECATPPHVQVRHRTWLSFTRPSPALVLQATNAGVRRPEYEATCWPIVLTCHIFLPTRLIKGVNWVNLWHTYLLADWVNPLIISVSRFG